MIYMCLETSCFHSYSVFLSGLILADIYVYLTRDSVLTRCIQNQSEKCE
jgi:hypothetical protein